MDDVAQMLIVFGTVGAVILLPIYWRAQMRRRVLEAVKDMANSGTAMSTDLVLSLMGPIQPPPPTRPSRERDLRRGYLLVALAVAIAIVGTAVYSMAYMSGDNDPKLVGIGIGAFAAIPGCIGAAFILLGLGQKREA
jgi:membrane associated rhomboid family serine protease